jgi:hypothetical protein
MNKDENLLEWTRQPPTMNKYNLQAVEELSGALLLRTFGKKDTVIPTQTLHPLIHITATFCSYL